MKTLPEIQAAIEKLSRQEFWELAKWFDQRRDEVWDQEMDEDAAAGRLDRLFEQADRDFQAGKTTPLP